MKKLAFVVLLICALALCLSACGQTCNHSFSEWIIVTQPSCIAQGQQMRICSLCQGQEWLPVKKVGHSYGKNGKCTLCGATEGVIYQISDDGTYAIVVGYSGTATNVKIAATYDGLPVRAICDRAFDSNAITSVAIPDSITTISGSAFGDCRNLTNIAVAEGNQNYCSIDCNLYSKDGKTLVQYAVGKPDTSFTVPDSVTTIGEYAFFHCSNLTSVTLGNSVATIGNSAFYYCPNLTSIVIPDSVTAIGNSAFFSCPNLTSVTLGNSVATIGEYAFYNCDSLTGVVIGNSVTTIGNFAFNNCDGLTSVTLGSSVTSIGDSAFNGCSNLTSIVIPNSVTTIGEYAFFHCSNLTSIVIPDSVTSIGDSAFYNCDGLTSVTLGSGVTTIGSYAFFHCSKLTNIAVATGNQNYCSIDCNLYSKDGKTLVQYAVGKSDTSFTVPDSVTAIGDSAFTNCTKLTSVTLGNSVITIGNDAFAGCSKLTSVTLGNSVASIGGYAFYGCNLKNVYYTGSAEEWKQISINNGNNHLTKATIHYNYVPEHKE